jgi:hypothetical protein
MIYLGTHTEFHVHNFYYDGYLYAYDFHNNAYYYTIYGAINNYFKICEPFEYELPETLIELRYGNFDERIDILMKRIEQIIYDGVSM